MRILASAVPAPGCRELRRFAFSAIRLPSLTRTRRPYGRQTRSNNNRVLSSRPENHVLECCTRAASAPQERTILTPRAALLPFLYWIGSRVSPSRGKPLTARLAGRRAGSHALASRGRSIYQPVHSLRMNKKVTFPERVTRLQAAAESLRVVLEIVEAEAIAIADAHKRFSAKKPQSRSVNSAE